LPAVTLITQVFDPGADGFNIDSIWSRILNAAEVSTLPKAMPQVSTESHRPAAAIASRRRKAAISKLLRFAVAAGAVGMIFLVPELWWLWILLGGLGAAGIAARAPKEIDTAAYSNRYLELAKRWNKEIENWRVRCGVAELLTLRSLLEQANVEYRSLNGEEKRRRAAYQNVRRTRQLRDFLDSFLICNAGIKGIGPAKLATLASFGIESAAHVSTAALQGAPGFGPVNSGNLLAWRSKLENRFVYREQPNDADRQELARINAEIFTKGAQLRKLLIPGAENLSKLVIRSKTALAAPDPLLVRLHQELEQAKCDLIFLGHPVPDISQLVPSPPLPASGIAATSLPLAPVANVRCPRCSAPMVRRLAQKGVHAGKSFWGCSRFPRCKGTRS
jgi:hypothetical protein